VYVLGIDLGTTFTAAAVWRDGRAEICSLGGRSAVIPSVLMVREDDSLLVGEAANRRALSEPGRVAREFKRRFGDSTPVLLGGTPYSADTLTARLLACVVADVTTREGGEPAAICISHPANWGPFKTDLLRQAVRMADLNLPVIYTTEPEAAAISYSQEQRLAVGEIIAVYDLGGGTFDAAVLRRTPDGFTILGQPEGIERLGGIDIDAAVFHHVVKALGDAYTSLDEDDPSAITAVARLRQECTEAKEALSSDTDVAIPVLLPGLNTEIRLTRAELETMVRPALYGSIEALKRALRSATVDPEDLTAVLLVGGSSRMPLVAQLVGAELGRPVAVDAHPKHAVALGAAWLASGQATPGDASVGALAAHDPTVGGSADDTGPAAVPRTAGVTVPAADTAAASMSDTAAADAMTEPPTAQTDYAPPPPPPQSPASSPTPVQSGPMTPVQSGPMTPVQSGPMAPALPPAAQLPGGYQQFAPHPTGSPQSGSYPQQPGDGRAGTGPGGYGFAASTTPALQPDRPRLGNRGVLAAIGAVLLVGVVAAGGWAVTHRGGNGDDPIRLSNGTTTTASTDNGASPTGSPAGTPTVEATSVSAGEAQVPPPTTGTTGLLTVSFTGSGSVGGAVSCRGTCSLRVTQGQTVRLSASPATGFEFTRWTGCDSTSGRDCSVTVRDQTSVGVAFTKTAAGATTATSTTTNPPPTTTTSTTTNPPPTTTTTTTSPPAQTPGSVSSMSLGSATQTTLVVDWGSAPRASRYRLGWTESPGGRPWDSSGSNYGGGPVTLIGLLPGHSYSVRVTPYNDAGDGPTTTRTASTLP
jgi:actin-like ATPase involved in cell morphogenesis